MDLTSVETAAVRDHPKTIDGYVEYGTAGFRTRSQNLDHVLFRMGLLAVLRSKIKKATIGVMITASHNPEPDNGVKLVDPDGEMLEASWEKIATSLANVPDTEVSSTIQKIIDSENIDATIKAKVIIGRDTRKSSEALSKAVIAGVRALNGTWQDFGVITTPQLHYLVACTNDKGAYGEPTLEGYYKKLAEAFRSNRIGSEAAKRRYSGKLQVDAANGVGALAAKEFRKKLGDLISLDVFNDGSGELNHLCGADFVKVQQAPASNVPMKPNVSCASIDGDADRLVYYYTDDENKFHLLDGDRIATLVAEYFQDLISESELSLRLGLVQTAYANGGSTNYIENVLKVPVACVPTGVKHLHKKALEFDIGVYFEANGHGTVVLQKTAVSKIREAASKTDTSKQTKAAVKLSNVINIINEKVGDALSDLLLVETILYEKDWDLCAWEACYSDLPNRQLKVKVQDRNVISTTDAERTCVSPDGLQSEIDKIVARYPKGRSFVRPSGTEDVVRVYAEAENASDVERLAAEVCLIVYKLAGGVGPEPVLPIAH